MRKKAYLHIVLSVLVLWMSACSVTRTVPAGDRLYLGADVSWKGPKQPDRQDLEEGMADRVTPKPNSRVLGIPLGLMLYNLGNKPKGKGLNYLLREKWGQAPVLASQAHPDYTRKVLESYLQDNGFFQAEVSGGVDNVGSKKAKASYTVTPHTRYYVDSVSYQTDTTTRLGAIVKRGSRFSYLRPGKPYSLQTIKDERSLIASRLKNQGYYYFTPDDIIVLVDSSHSGKVRLMVRVKDTISRSAVTPFRLRHVRLYPAYDLQDTTSLTGTPVVYKGLEIVDPDSLFKPYLFDRSVFLRPDSLYRIRAHTITLSRLMNLGTFKFVTSQFTRVRDTVGLLDVRLLMTPYPKHALQFNLTGNSRSNNYVGSQVSIAAKNRNWLRAADLLEMNVAGGFETQVGGGRQINNNAYNLSGGLSVTIPKFYVPGFHIRPSTPYVPRTKIAVSYEYLRNPGLYTLNGFNFQFGYQWKQSRYLDHTFNPVDISYVLPSHTTASFDSLIAVDPSQREAIEKQFILGSDYTITYSNQRAHRTHTYYASGNVDVAGNLAGLLIGGGSSGKGKQLFGTTFAQYLRLSADVRDYWQLNRKDQWVNRLFLGYGIPYGNSTSLPFVKQFFNGGSNSLRGFRARTLGPGTYDSTENRYLANEAGDIKVEFNSEFRAKLFSIVNGAVFFDAGNIWLKHRDPLRPGGEFHFNNFLGQMAADAGAGLRIDASILIVRFDLAFPLREPYLPPGERWVIRDIDFGSPAWRKNNLILNIAIGYPF
jgi:outer membrane protein assembly factor BamA